MTKYNVEIDLQSIDILVDADSIEEAKDKAYDGFMNMSDAELLGRIKGWVGDAKELEE